MFTKNIKTIVIVAVALVVAILVSCLVAVNNDKKVAEELAGQLNGQVQQNATDAQKKIDELNKTIADLKATLEKAEAGLADANEAIKAQQAVIDALKEAGVDMGAWGEASVAMVEKMEALADVLDTWETWEDEETGITAADLYAYIVSWEVNEDGSVEVTHVYDNVQELYIASMVAVARGTSVDEMDAVIAAFEAELAAIPTVLDVLYTTIDTVNADDVTYDDYANIKYATYLWNMVVDNGVLVAAEKDEEPGEYETVAKELTTIYTTFQPVVVESFETLVAALPTKTETIRMSHSEAIVGARAEHTFLLEVLELTEGDLSKDKDYNDAVAHLVACETALAPVEVLYKAAQKLNKDLADASKAEDWAIKADVATREKFDVLYGKVETWVLSVVEAGFYDAETKTFDAEVISYYDATIMAGYEAELAKAAGTMSTEAVKFINAVAAIEKVTNESKAELDACVAAYVAFTKAAGNYSPAEVDYILGVEENGVVAAWNTLAAYQTAHADILATIKAVEDYAASLLVKCEKDHGDKACDCKNIGERNPAVTFVNHDEWIIKLVGFYGLEETVINEKALAVYKAARLESAIATAIGNAQAAHDDSNNADKATILANLKTFIGLAAQTEYKFEVKMTCIDPENKDHKCNCAADLKNYELVEDAATKALAVFTYDYCEGFYAEK